jgi:hypothetical protein
VPSQSEVLDRGAEGVESRTLIFVVQIRKKFVVISGDKRTHRRDLLAGGSRGWTVLFVRAADVDVSNCLLFSWRLDVGLDLGVSGLRDGFALSCVLGFGNLAQINFAQHIPRAACYLFFSIHDLFCSFNFFIALPVLFSVNIQHPKLRVNTYVFSIGGTVNFNAVCCSKLKDARLPHAVEVVIEFDPSNRLSEVWVPANDLEEAPKISGLLRAVDQ